MMRVPGWNPQQGLRLAPSCPKGRGSPPALAVGTHPEWASPLKTSLEDQKGLSKLNNMGRKSSLSHQASVHLPSSQALLAKAEIKQEPTPS